MPQTYKVTTKKEALEKWGGIQSKDVREAVEAIEQEIARARGPVVIAYVYRVLSQAAQETVMHIYEGSGGWKVEVDELHDQRDGSSTRFKLS